MFIRKRITGLVKPLMGLLTALMSLVSVAYADPPVSGPLSLKIFPSISQTMSLGEPILVHYEFQNASSGEHLILSHNSSADDWYTFILTDKSGQAIKISSSHHAHSNTGLFQDKEVGISHGGKDEGDIVIPTYEVLTRPGNYTLSIHAKLSYVSEPDTPVDVDPAIHFGLDHYYSVPLTVTVADSNRLRATAERLRQEAESPVFSGSANDIVGALFSMPERQALPSWQALISDPKVPERVLREAVNQLARLHSNVAMDLLAQLYWNPAQPVNVISWAEVGQHIAKVYNSGDASLKTHVKELFADHGIQIPDIMPEKSHPN